MNRRTFTYLTAAGILGTALATPAQGEDTLADLVGKCAEATRMRYESIQTSQMIPYTFSGNGEPEILAVVHEYFKIVNLTGMQDTLLIYREDLYNTGDAKKSFSVMIDSSSRPEVTIIDTGADGFSKNDYISIRGVPKEFATKNYTIEYDIKLKSLILNTKQFGLMDFLPGSLNLLYSSIPAVSSELGDRTAITAANQPEASEFYRYVLSKIIGSGELEKPGRLRMFSPNQVRVDPEALKIVMP